MKLSAWQLPAISPITQARSWQRSPSSRANSASSGVVAATWIRRWRSIGGRPARQGRPPIRIALRSCTHSTWRVSSAASPSPTDVKASRARASASPAPLASVAGANISEWNGWSARLGRQRISGMAAATARGGTRAGDGLEIMGERLICSLYVPILPTWQCKGRGKRYPLPAPFEAHPQRRISRRSPARGTRPCRARHLAIRHAAGSNCGCRKRNTAPPIQPCNRRRRSAR